MLDFELLLVLGALAFYLQDSAALLYADELIVERVGRGWRMRPGAGMLICGRRPFVPNPLAPHRPLIRVTVDQVLDDVELGVDAKGVGIGRAPFYRALVPVQVCAAVLLLLFFPGLPWTLHTWGTGPGLLGWLALVYLVIALMGLNVFRQRRALGLTTHQCAGLMVQGVFCAPLAINIVRKVSQVANPLAPCGFITALQADERQDLTRVVVGRLDDMLNHCAGETREFERLSRQRERLLAEGAGK